MQLTKRCDIATIMLPMQHEANLVQHLLRQRNVSLRRLAADIGISPSTLSRWASGKQTPSPQSCRQLARSLAVPVEQIFAFAGYLELAHEPTNAAFFTFREYGQHDEWHEDMAAMIKNLIPECYPLPEDSGFKLGNENKVYRDKMMRT